MDQRLQILVIDDDEDDFRLTKDLLAEAYGTAIDVQWSGAYETGLQALKQRTYDICLLDYRLGAHTGLELLAESRELTERTPIILLTGQGEREVDLQAMEAGAADFLTKDHLRADTLERAIRYSLGRHRDRLALKRLNEMLETRVEQRTRELAEANRSLQLADQRKDEFLATLAHELRNPLAPISNSLELMNHSPDDAALCRESRQTMRRQLNQLVRLTDDLLEVSRVSRGKVSLRKEPVGLRTVIDQAVEAAQPWINARGQLLKVHVPAEDIVLEADLHRMAQVVGNLLNNASKFSPQAGRIDLTVSRAASSALVSVRDEGLGLEPHQLTRIFGMFEQVETSLQRSEAGLGIGLTLVRELTQMHGGKVEARSEGLGRGSEFVIELPLPMAAAKTPAKQPAAPTSKADSGYNILVVDDNQDSLNSMSKLLALSGYKVTSTLSGKAALDQAAATAPRVALLDIGLPDLDGYEVARELRRRQDGKPLSLIALTGWGQPADKARAEEAGFDLHMLKPVDYAKLLKVLAQIQ